MLHGDFDSVERRGRELPGDFYWMPLLQVTRLEILGRVQAAWELVPEVGVAEVQFASQVRGARARLRLNLGDEFGARRELEIWAEELRWEDGPVGAEPGFAEIDECLPALGDESLVRRIYDFLLGWEPMRISRTSARSFDRIRGAHALRLERLEAELVGPGRDLARLDAAGRQYSKRS